MHTIEDLFKDYQQAVLRWQSDETANNYLIARVRYMAFVSSYFSEGGGYGGLGKVPPSTSR